MDKCVHSYLNPTRCIHHQFFRNLSNYYIHLGWSKLLGCELKDVWPLNKDGVIRTPPLGGVLYVITQSVRCPSECLSLCPSSNFNIVYNCITIRYMSIIFLMTRPFRLYHTFWTCDHDCDLWPFEKKNFYIGHNFLS